MALNRFWMNVNAAGDPAVAGAAVVSGYDEKDFEFLDRRERSKLKRNVEILRRSAENAGDSAPAFREILDVLRPDKYLDADALIVGKTLERQLGARLPRSVRELRIRTGRDSTGDPGIWISVILDDSAAEDDATFRAETRAVRRLLEDTLLAREDGRWPYVSFRTAAEQAELDTVAAEDDE